MNLCVISNHSPENWSTEQLDNWDSVFYFSFPNVPPRAEAEEINEIVENTLGKIDFNSFDKTTRFSVQGEQTVSIILISRLKEQGYIIVVPTTERKVTEKTEGGKTEKKTIFKFVQWRELNANI